MTTTSIAPAGAPPRATSLRASGGVEVPQPVPGHGNPNSTPQDITPLTPHQSGERYAPGHFVGAGFTGAGIGLVGGFFSCFALAPHEWNGKATTAIFGGPVLGAALAIGIGMFAASQRGHSYLTKVGVHENGDFDGGRADAAIAAGLVGATAGVPASAASVTVSVRLDKLVGTTDSLATADAALYDKATIDGVRDGTARQRVIVEIPRSSDDHRDTVYATYEASSTGKPGGQPGVDVPKDLRAKGIPDTAEVAGALVAADSPSTKTERRGNEIWELQGAASVVERHVHGKDLPGAAFDDRIVATADWHKTSERFIGYADAAKQG